MPQCATLAFAAGAVWLAAAILAPSAMAETEAADTLAKVKASGRIVLGVRSSAKPFSYRLPDNGPAGFAVDLCRRIVNDISQRLGKRIETAWHPVTPENRIPLVVAGDVDLECGSTTQTEQRRKLVAFSPVYFIAGTKLLVATNSPIRSYRDLGGKTVVVTSGTTNEAAMHLIAERLLIRMKFVTTSDHSLSFALLRAGGADAFATDDVLLAGLAASPEGAGYSVVGDYLSYEPYGLVFRKNDPDLAGLIDASFRQIASTGELARLYRRWLIEPLPTGEVLNIPISAELAQVFRQLGQPD